MKNENAMYPIDRMLVEQTCRELVTKAASLIDAKDYDGYVALFTEGGVLVRPGAEPLQGRMAIVDSYRSRPTGRITRHLLSNTLVSLTSETQAHITSCVLLWTGDENDVSGPFGRPAHERQAIGEFEDWAVLTPEGWLIERREARFILFH